MTLTLRYMRRADIAQVASIDRVSFDPPWSERSYEYEIAESTYSHMMVLEQSSAQGERPLNPWQRLMQNLSGAPRADHHIAAYGGLWKIADEAHISTIATHPEFRGRGYGEIALLGMVRKSLLLGAAYIVLEVRVSNTTAQNLYLKHGFITHGVKKRYYHNNGEDAYDMRLDLMADDARDQIERAFAGAVKRQGFIDQYTTTANPTAAHDS
jgi:ribosomal-protein-alanine N-acetyltransferase